MVRHRKKPKAPISKDQQAMLESFKATNPDRPVTFVTTPQGEKMSELLETLVEPYREPDLTEGETRNLYMMGIVGWNAALVEGQVRAKLIDEFIRKIAKPGNKADEADLRAMIAELVDRKRKLYPAVKRFIIDFRLTPGPNGANLSVISTAQDPQKQKK